MKFLRSIIANFCINYIALGIVTLIGAALIPSDSVCQFCYFDPRAIIILIPLLLAWVIVTIFTASISTTGTANKIKYIVASLPITFIFNLKVLNNFDYSHILFFPILIFLYIILIKKDNLKDIVNNPELKNFRITIVIITLFILMGYFIWYNFLS
ncbi:hypothetical protein C0583_05730 [Candidatus Parcubacteria bacterium]|mgnify:CR=1 FL=1|nr:MAG: hypothetical protein C0583_05730 [Candidatus Parcubacteria bacterium]